MWKSCPDDADIRQFSVHTSAQLLTKGHKLHQTNCNVPLTGINVFYRLEQQTSNKAVLVGCYHASAHAHTCKQIYLQRVGVACTLHEL